MRDMDDFSIDLEALGTRCTAPIITIGVQQFNRDTGKLGATFYKEVDIDSAIRAGRVQADTLAWWITQNKNAQRVFTNKEKVHIATALQELTTWMRSMSFAPRAWGNGATFDIGILEYAYDHACVGLREAWHFTNIRDIRTLVEAADFDTHTVPRVGTHHNALDDAIFQANVVHAAWRKVRGYPPIGAGKKGKAAPQPAPESDDGEEL